MQLSVLIAVLPAFIALASAVPADKDRTNPLAKNPKAPVGSKDNAAPVFYSAQDQPGQNAILQRRPSLTEPKKHAGAVGESGPSNRRETYKAHGAADKGMSKEDQPIASQDHRGQPGDLYNVHPSEQKKQATEAGRASRAVRGNSPERSYTQQIPDNSQGMQPMPKPIAKKGSKSSLRGKRSLYARAAAAKAFNDVYDNFDVLMKRDVDPMDFDGILSDLYARDAEPEASFYDDDEVELFVKRDAYPEEEEISFDLYARDIEPEYNYLYARNADSYYAW